MFARPPRHARLTASLLGLVLAIGIAAPAAAVGDHFRGRLVEFHAEDASMTRMVTEGYALEANGRDYVLNFHDASLASYVGRDVDVAGSRSGHTITVASYQLMTDATAASQSKNVAVLLFNFQNDTRQPYTPDFASGVYFTNPDSVANYFAEESFGQLSMTGQVFGWYTIPYDNSGCDYTTWSNAARTAATNAGANLSGFTNFVYAFPSASGCGWAGLAYLPGTDSFNNQSMDLRVASHELSHNFGVHHASSYDCVTNGVRVSTSANPADCTLSEYGDPFSVMGSASTR